MEVKDTRGGGSYSHPFLPFGLFVEQSVARSNLNSSYVCLINLKMMTTDAHDPYNCRISFLIRLVLGVSRLNFNSWAPGIFILSGLEIRECQYFSTTIRGGERKRKFMRCICMYVFMYVSYILSRANCKPAVSMMLKVDLLVRCLWSGPGL